ncbi:MAG: elongation factor G, partial [Anaerolineae bacterium]|nr:elongation factor G [Anaerolineae bacterium]
LYVSGATTRLGKVEEGSTVSDYEPEEVRRHISISTSVLPLEWNGNKINLIDAPGYSDFAGEAKGAIRAADAGLVLVDASSGVEVGTELAWSYLEEVKLPRGVVIAKMDRENARFEQALASVREAFPGVKFTVVQLPCGEQHEFDGVVDPVHHKAFLGEKGQSSDIPASMKAQAEKIFEGLVEDAAEGDDEYLMKYLDGEALTDAEVQRGLKEAAKAGKIIPVFCVAGTAMRGVQALLDAIINFLPSPRGAIKREAVNPATDQTETLKPVGDAPLAAQVFKTVADPYGKISYFRVFSGTISSDSRVWNARSNAEERLGQIFIRRGKEQINVDKLHAGDIGIALKLDSTTTGDTLCDRGHPLQLPPITYPSPVYLTALSPRTKTDLDKMGSAIQRLLEEDPTLKVRREAETGETIMEGMGESHIDVAVRKMQSKFGVNLDTAVPKVPYRETITRKIEQQGRHKKQSGGRGQFGDVYVRFEPNERGGGFEFVDEVVGGSVPRQYIPAVEKGLREIMEQGVVAGYPTVDFKAALYYGSSHPVDSSEMAFKLAAHIAFKEGLPKANPVLLEPVMHVVVTIPSQYAGDIMGDMNQRRGRVLGIDQQGNKTIIEAEVPLAEMMRYATELRSMTQGRGIYTMEFVRYEEVPQHLTSHIVEVRRKELAEEKG